MPTVDEVVRDPEFQGLPWGERHKVLKTIDPDYAALPQVEQNRALSGLKQMPFWGGNQSPITQQQTVPSQPKSAIDRVKDYFTTPPEQPKNLSDFITNALPKSIANTVYGAGKMVADTMEGGPALAGYRAMGSPQTLGDAGSSLKDLAVNAVSPFGLAGPEKFKEAWTTAPAQSTLSVAPILKGAGSAALSPRATLSTLSDIVKPKMNQTAQLADKWKIPTTLAEETTGRSSRTDTLMERVPWKLGNKSFRAKQYEAAHNAAKDAISKYMIDPSADDVLLANEAHIDNLYNNVKNVSVKPENSTLQPTETRATAKQLLDRYPDVFKKLQDSKLEGAIRNIVGDTSPQVANYLDASYNPTTKITPATMSFDDAWQLRKNLGTKIGQAKKLLINGAIDETELSQLNSLYKAVSNDIDSNPNLAQPFKAANDAYKQYNVKYNLLAKAYEKVTRDVGDQKLFSPAKFSNELDRMARDAGAGEIYSKSSRIKTGVFTPAEKAELTGLANILQVAKRSGQYMENPPTGNRWGAITTVGGTGGAAFATGGIPGVVQAAAAGASIALITKFLTTSKMGRSIARRAARVSPTSPAMKKLMAQAAIGASMRQPGQTIGEDQDFGDGGL